MFSDPCWREFKIMFRDFAFVSPAKEKSPLDIVRRRWLDCSVKSVLGTQAWCLNALLSLKVERNPWYSSSSLREASISQAWNHCLQSHCAGSSEISQASGGFMVRCFWTTASTPLCKQELAIFWTSTFSVFYFLFFLLLFSPFPSPPLSKALCMRGKHRQCYCYCCTRSLVPYFLNLYTIVSRVQGFRLNFCLECW